MSKGLRYMLLGFGIAVVAILLIVFLIAPVIIGAEVFSPLSLASWSLGVISLTGFVLIGKRIWYAWFINIVAQACWIVFWFSYGQPGPIITNVVYILVFAQNAILWSREYHIEEGHMDKIDRRLQRITIPKKKHREEE